LELSESHPAVPYLTDYMVRSPYSELHFPGISSSKEVVFTPSSVYMALSESG
jgi:hypothetical protein